MTTGSQSADSPGGSNSYRLSADETVSEGVINATADALETDPRNLEPLYAVVDPDALDTVFHSIQHGTSNGEGRVEFGYHDYEIVIKSDGLITVTPIQPQVAEKADD